MAEKEKEKKKPQTAAEPETEETVQAPEEEPDTEKADETALLRQQLQEANDKWLRTLAEYDNFRKRSQKEKEALYADVKAETIAKILPVIDNFERAAAADSDPESYKKGIEMTVKQLLETLTALGVEAFGAAGDAFDPNIHSGVMHEENDDLGENTVSDVFQKGYKLGDRIIRHATVKVAN